MAEPARALSAYRARRVRRDAEPRSWPADRRERGRSIGDGNVRAFKSFSAREINKTRAAGTKFAWQRGFHEHVARNEKDLAAIREYIQNNPVKWELDEENPARQRATALPQGGS
jgi:REP element-mobilizing transposase RayT